MKTIYRRSFGFAFALLIIAGFALPKLIPFNGTEGPAEAVTQAATTLRVSVHRVVPEGLVERLATTGTVRANEEVELVSEISGKVSAILFREGSRVEAGEVLVKIDDSELAAERERAVYRVELAERREARQRQLLADGVISQEDYDYALNQLNVLRAELRLIEAQLVKTEIRAPFRGTVGLRYVSPGSYLSPQTRIASLQDVDSVKIDFSVPEKYSALMRVGGEITFRVKGSEELYRGEIYAIEPSVDSNTRSLELRARSPNPDRLLTPGAFADVELVVREVDDALTVPSIAVIPELGGKKVFVYAAGKAEPRPVETGIRTEEKVQISIGIEPGDLVITSGLLQLRPGLEVELQEAIDDEGPAS